MRRLDFTLTQALVVNCLSDDDELKSHPNSHEPIHPMMADLIITR
jgi:hypothetical protein